MKFFILVMGLFYASLTLGNFEDFPSDIKGKIIEYLELKDLIALSGSSKTMRKALNLNWKDKFKNTFGEPLLQDKENYLPGEKQGEDNVDWQVSFFKVVAGSIENNRKKVVEGSFSGVLEAPDSRDNLLIAVDLSGIKFDSFYIDFVNTRLEGTNFQGSIFPDDIKLSGANISGTNFKGAKLVDFFGDNLGSVTLGWLKNRGAVWHKDNPPLVN